MCLQVIEGLRCRDFRLKVPQSISPFFNGHVKCRLESCQCRRLIFTGAFNRVHLLFESPTGAVVGVVRHHRFHHPRAVIVLAFQGRCLGVMLADDFAEA